MKYIKSTNNYISKNDIIKNLSCLHNSSYIIVTKEIFKTNLLIETKYKIDTRIEEISHIIESYKCINSVNNLLLNNYETTMNNINKIIIDYIENNKEYKLYPIHGDCHNNNIIMNENKIIFIDPRGYFGDTKLYGLKEYDIAKIYFSLSGYDIFDNMIINNVNIENNNINIDFLNIDNDLFNEPIIIRALFISIWLGNSHIFVKEKYKMITSYFIALYYGTMYLSNINTSKSLK